MDFHIKNAAAVKVLEEIAEAYHALFPQKYEEFRRMVRDEEARLIRHTALSEEGTMLSLCKIPEEIYAFVKWQMRKRCNIDDFFRWRNNYYLLCKVWSDLRIRRRDTATMSLKDCKWLE